MTYFLVGINQNPFPFFEDVPLDSYSYDSNLNFDLDYNELLELNDLGLDLDAILPTGSTQQPTNFRTRLRFRRQAESDEEDSQNESSGSDVIGSGRNDSGAGSSNNNNNDVNYDLYEQYLDYVQEDAKEERTEDKPETEENRINNDPPRGQGEGQVQDDDSSSRRNSEVRTTTETTTTKLSNVVPRRRGERRRKKLRSTTAPPDERQYNYNNAYDGSSVYSEDGETESSRRNSKLFMFLPLIVMASSGAVCYFFARVACKLCMQEFGVSLPLTLITPATIVVYCYLCQLQNWTRVRLTQFRYKRYKVIQTHITQILLFLGCRM